MILDYIRDILVYLKIFLYDNNNIYIINIIFSINTVVQISLENILSFHYCFNYNKNNHYYYFLILLNYLRIFHLTNFSFIS